MSTTGRRRGADDGESPLAPPIPSFASLRAPRRTHAALDVLLAPSAEQRPVADAAPVAQPSPEPVRPVADARVRPGAPSLTPRPAEWPDLLWFGVRVASAALRLPGVLLTEPARRLRRLLGE